jgi:ribosomal protein L37AE/L43A
MCFRPASAAKPIECPNCKKKIPVIGGIKQKKCPHCGTDLTGVTDQPQKPNS